MTKTPTVTLLLEAGISLPAGFPSTEQITERVLSGRGIVRHTDGTYYFSDGVHPGLPTDYLPRVHGFLHVLLREATSYYQSSSRKSINYEDLAFMASQIADSESGEYDNPIVQAMVDKIRPEVESILASTENRPTHRDWSIWRVASESLNYIKDVAWRYLSRSPDRINYLEMITAACQEGKHLGIFTLNHDTLLEHLFDSNRIAYSHGFGPIENGVRYWNPNVLRRAAGVKLYKLHGSVDWFRLRPDAGSWRDERIDIPQNGDVWHTQSPFGKRQLPGDGRPIFLVGTFNKIIDYGSPLYLDLHYALMSRLRQTTRLVVCGYSFNDKAINAQITQWLYEQRKPRLIVCHRNADSLRDQSRGAIRKKWDGWRDEGILTVIQKYIEELRWEDIKSFS